MKEIKTVFGQTLYDLAIQEYGHLDGFFLLLEDNEGIINDLSETPPAGTRVLIRLQVPELSENNRAIAAELARRGKLVVSGVNNISATPTIPIYVNPGYWQNDYAAYQNWMAIPNSRLQKYL